MSKLTSSQRRIINTLVEKEASVEIIDGHFWINIMEHKPELFFWGMPLPERSVRDRKSVV